MSQLESHSLTALGKQSASSFSLVDNRGAILGLVTSPSEPGTASEARQRLTRRINHTSGGNYGIEVASLREALMHTTRSISASWKNQNRADKTASVAMLAIRPNNEVDGLDVTALHIGGAAIYLAHGIECNVFGVPFRKVNRLTTQMLSTEPKPSIGAGYKPYIDQVGLTLTPGDRLAVVLGPAIVEKLNGHVKSILNRCEQLLAASATTEILNRMPPTIGRAALVIDCIDGPSPQTNGLQQA